MKKLCIALVSALALGIVNAEETDLVVVGSGGHHGRSARQESYCS